MIEDKVERRPRKRTSTVLNIAKLVNFLSLKVSAEHCEQHIEMCLKNDDLGFTTYYPVISTKTALPNLKN